jgi:hypothetical protein
MKIKHYKNTNVETGGKKPASMDATVMDDLPNIMRKNQVTRAKLEEDGMIPHINQKCFV